MAKISKKFILLIHLFCSVISSDAFSSEITFFDVGQGNCTVVKFAWNQPLLVDAGSSSKAVSPFEARSASYAKDIPDRIANKIISYMPTGITPTLNVVVSHSDADHHNLVSTVIETVRKTKKKLTVWYLLGGSEDDYKKTSLAGKPKGKDIKIYTDTTVVASIPCPPTFSCDILAALKTADPNSNSIVLRIAKGKESVILTGDATGKTTKKIPAIAGGTTVLQASHHGADTHESNSVDWFQKTNPEYVIISAGTRADYGHPRQKMVRNALESKNLKTKEPLHLLQYYSDWSFFDTIRELQDVVHYTVGRSDKDYLSSVTELGIFSTASQGDITYKFGSGFDFFRKIVPSPKPIEYRVMERFLKNTGRDETTAVIFPPMDFTPGKLSIADFESLVDVIISPSSPITGLVSFDLSRVNLPNVDYLATPTFYNDKSPFDGVLNKLMDASLPSLQELCLPVIRGKKGSPTAQKDAIKAAWVKKFGGPKGLRFIEY